MDKNELLCKLTEYEIRLMKAKIGLLRAGMADTSGYDGQIAAIEYVKTLAMMLDEVEKAGELKEPPQERQPAGPIPEPEDRYIPISVFNMCRILSDKCDKNIDVMKESGANETYDKLRYADIVKLKDNCRKFLTDWEIHDPARS